MNILWATMLAMERAAAEIKVEFNHIYIDGNRVPKNLTGTAVIKGDAKIAEIAAASILAKVHRDQLMVEYAEMYPGYGFESHFGYPTPLHLERLKVLGPSPIHRRSFGPVAHLLPRQDDQISLFSME
jgi:ribonuclease HII